MANLAMLINGILKNDFGKSTKFRTVRKTRGMACME